MRNELYARNPKTVRYSIETISFLSPKNWAFIPKKKNRKTLCVVTIAMICFSLASL